MNFFNQQYSNQVDSQGKRFFLNPGTTEPLKEKYLNSTAHFFQLAPIPDHGHEHFRLNSGYNFATGAEPPEATEPIRIKFKLDDITGNGQPPLLFEKSPPVETDDITYLFTNTQIDNDIYNVYPDGVRRHSTLSSQDIKKNKELQASQVEYSKLKQLIPEIEKNPGMLPPAKFKELQNRFTELEIKLNPTGAIIDSIKNMAKSLKQPITQPVEPVSEAPVEPVSEAPTLSEIDEKFADEFSEKRKQERYEKLAKLNKTVDKTNIRAYFESKSAEPSPTPSRGSTPRKIVSSVIQDLMNKVGAIIGPKSPSLKKEVTKELKTFTNELTEAVVEKELTPTEATELFTEAAIKTNMEAVDEEDSSSTPIKEVISPNGKLTPAAKKKIEDTVKKDKSLPRTLKDDILTMKGKLKKTAERQIEDAVKKDKSLEGTLKDAILISKGKLKKTEQKKPKQIKDDTDPLMRGILDAIKTRRGFIQDEADQEDTGSFDEDDSRPSEITLPDTDEDEKIADPSLFSSQEIENIFYEWVISEDEVARVLTKTENPTKLINGDVYKKLKANDLKALRDNMSNYDTFEGKGSNIHKLEIAKAKNLFSVLTDAKLAGIGWKKLEKIVSDIRKPTTKKDLELIIKQFSSRREEINKLADPGLATAALKKKWGIK